MDKVRVIVSSGEGGKEQVFFTHDLHAPVDDFLRIGFVVDTDTQIPDNLPPSFPTEYVLKVS